MRRIILTLLLLCTLLAAREGYAQSPPGINYQGIARNTDGKPLAQKDISIRINIVKDADNGTVEYAEVHSVKTNAFGLFTLVIGTGSAEVGNFEMIAWGSGNKWLRVEMDPDGGNSFQLMGSQQWMSVPYAFFAKYTSNPLKAGDGISIVNNVISSTADNDATNELNVDLTLSSDHKLRLTDGGGTKEVDLSPLISAPTADKDEQQLSINASNELSISGGNKVNLTPYLDNTDNQQLSINASNELLITGGNKVNLAPYLDNTDNQDLSLTGNLLSLTKDPTPATIDLSPYRQDLSVNTTTRELTLSNDPTATPVSLRQDLHVVSAGNTRTLTIDNGVGVGFTVDDGDADPTNELQQLSYNAATKSISINGSTGNSVVIPESQTLNNVLSQGNDANGQRLSNIGQPTGSNDATTKQYVDAADAAISARINSNYAFKVGYNFSTLLAVSEVTLSLNTAKEFDDFNVVMGSFFTAPTTGTYVFTLDGTTTGLLASSAVNLQYNGTKYPVTVGSNSRFNSNFMFRLTAGQTVSVVATGLGIATSISGSFFGYKLL